jgi:4-amino-4-deoxy-L-arabinose transferase-like glycosyltransferase
VALAIPAAGLLTFLASSGELSRLRETRWFWGVPAALLPSVAWLLAFSRRAGLDPGAILQTQVLDRFREGIHHPRPFYYYFVSLPLEFLPWTLFQPGAFVVTFPTPNHPKRRPLLFLYSWVLGGFALLSLAAEKRPSYLLPLIPPLALLVAWLWETYLVRWDAASVRKWIEGPGLVGASVSLAGIFFLPSRAAAYPGLGARLVPLCLCYLVGWAAALTAARVRRRGAALLFLAGGACAGYLWIGGSLLPWLNGYKSARLFSERILTRIGTAPLGVYGDFQPAFAFYTRRRLTLVRRPEDLAKFLPTPPGAYCLVRATDVEVLRHRVPFQELDRQRVGHRTYILVGFRPEDPGNRGP